MDDHLWGMVVAGLRRVDRHAFASVFRMACLVCRPYLEGEAVLGYVHFWVISIAQDQELRQLRLTMAQLRAEVAQLRAERASLAE